MVAIVVVGVWRAGSTVLATALVLVGFLATAALAHPLGNFTTNTSATVIATPEGLAVEYVLDLAEIPALQAQQRLDVDGDGSVSANEAVTEERDACAQIAERLSLQVDGAPVELSGPSGSLTFPDGEAGLQTMRLECDFFATVVDLDRGAVVEVVDSNATERVGWHEIVVRGDNAGIVGSDVLSSSPSNKLLEYPEEQLTAPLDIREVTFRVEPGDGTAESVTAPGAGNGVDRVTAAFTGLVNERASSPGFAALAVLLAVGLGGLHALAPGHGKTIMAAYVVGQRGTMRQILGIGVTVAITHTAGVLALGLAITASTTLAPDRLYPWFGIASGVLIVVIGGRLLGRAAANRRPHTGTPLDAATDDRVLVASGAVHSDHDHEHDVPDTSRSGHAVVEHDHGGGAHTHVLPGPNDTLRWREYVALGFAGGLVPSPSALVVLLGALALGRAAFGVGLVIAYGIGLAATLVVAGLILIRARVYLARKFSDPAGSRLPRLASAIPVLTACLVIAGGVLLTLRSLATL